MALLLFWGCVLAATETWYTDFELVWFEWSEWYISTDEGQTTWSFTVVLTNHDRDTIQWEFHFVDAVKMWDYYACKADTETWVFGRYLQMDWNTSFSVQPWETITWIVNFDFPESYSGVYDGCIVYSVKDDLGNVNSNEMAMDTSSRKAIPVHVQLQASKVSVHIIANLCSRGNSQTSNNNWYESRWKLLFYQWNSSTPVESWYVIMNGSWYWELTWVTILAGTYDVVYKWWHNLASYISNVTINEWDTLDFVVGNNLTWVWFFEQLDKFKYNSWWACQIAWDMPSSNGSYNFLINTMDLTVLWDDENLCPYGRAEWKNHVCDLNNDWWIDSNDDTVILSNLLVRDEIYYWSNHFSENSFWSVNYWEEFWLN
jgi:hypothetical protein